MGCENMATKRNLLKFLMNIPACWRLFTRAFQVYHEVELARYPLTTRTSIEKLMELLEPNLNHNLIRLGDQKDGGYVLVDCIRESSCVFSIGVGDNFSFDESISEKVESIIMVDHSVDFSPKIPNATFMKKKLVARVHNKATEVSLSDLYSTLEDGTPAILKMDIEGSEWDILESADEALLAKFDQLVIEFHGILERAKRDDLDKIITVMQKLIEQFEVVNTHANNYSDYSIFLNFPLVDVIEMTFLRKNLKYSSQSTNNIKHQNFPNNPNKPEIFITYPSR
jgi:hypothetical protein